MQRAFPIINWRGIFVMLAGLVFAQPVMAKSERAGQLEQVGFTRVVTDFLAQELGDTACVKVETDTTLLFGGAKEGCRNRLDTTGLYTVYQSAPDDIDLTLEKIARQIGADLSTTNVELTSANLVSVLRSAKSLPQLATSDHGLLVRSFAGDIYEVVMVNQGDQMAIASEMQLNELGLTTDQAFQLGRSQLGSHLGRVSGQNMHNVVVQTSSAGLGSAIPLLNAACGAQTQNTYWYVFDRNVVMTAETSNPVAVSNLLRLVNQGRADKTAYSDTLLVCQEGRWAVRADNGDIHFTSGVPLR